MLPEMRQACLYSVSGFDDAGGGEFLLKTTDNRSKSPHSIVRQNSWHAPCIIKKPSGAERAGQRTNTD